MWNPWKSLVNEAIDKGQEILGSLRTSDTRRIQENSLELHKSHDARLDRVEVALKDNGFEGFADALISPDKLTSAPANETEKQEG